mmetsp:Transcript_17196/g.30845  ORF Transcript_17196/g.30845 Transcript_17196/m.30845 type:complete len:254 (+) Transcript_17196:451-1212(+)
MFPALGFLIVSSTDNIMHAASQAAAMELRLLCAGSHTNDFIVSQTPSLSMSTPYHVLPWWCAVRRSLRMSVESKPALSAICLGMTSNACAKALMMSCCLVSTVSEYSRRCLLISISMAPPPPTTLECSTVLLTIISASCSDLSVSAMNCSAPPLSTMVVVLVSGQPVNTLNLSLPTWRSSKDPQLPSTLSFRSPREVWMTPPVALATRSRSFASTRPAQKISRSAKYWVARSPMGSFERTILAPEATMASSLS